MDEKDAVNLAVRALLEVVESGSKNIELAIMRRGREIEELPHDQVEALVKQINDEKEKAKEKKDTKDKDKR